MLVVTSALADGDPARGSRSSATPAVRPATSDGTTSARTWGGGCPPSPARLFQWLDSRIRDAIRRESPENDRDPAGNEAASLEPGTILAASVVTRSAEIEARRSVEARLAELDSIRDRVVLKLHVAAEAGEVIPLSREEADWRPPGHPGAGPAGEVLHAILAGRGLDRAQGRTATWLAEEIRLSGRSPGATLSKWLQRARDNLRRSAA